MGITDAENRRVRDLLSRCAARADRELERLLGPETGFHDAVREAALYSVRAGGKRLRPALVLTAAEACGASGDHPPPAALVAAAAVEMIHTYSLIHDDLPAMDNDDFRRGKPTNHKVFGEAVAILAGDLLLNHAFFVLADAVDDPALSVALTRELGRAAGGAGMIGGQTADILAERGRRPADGGTGFPGFESPSAGADLRLLEAIHRHKTAALIRASLVMGGLAAGADAARLEALGRYGERLGLAFQVIDDILDETAESAALGKSAGKDKAAGKLTYPGLLGLGRSREIAARLTDEAIAALAPLGSAAADLELLVRFNHFRES
jgi:geranylgeranyl diphosphate synthase type II